MAKSNYLENKILNLVYKNTAWTPPATVYAALFTVSPDDTGGGTEVTGGSYARQALTMGTPSNGSITNTLAVNFSGVPAGTIVAIGTYDASSAGNLHHYANLTSSIVVPSSGNADITFDVGNFTVTED